MDEINGTPGIRSSLLIQGGLLPGPKGTAPQIPKSMDAQVLM